MQHILPFSSIKYELTMKRRLLSVFLALTMILLMLPEITTALAAINNGRWEGSGTYYSELPTAIEVGTYTIWYRVVGDRNHFDVTDTKPRLWLRSFWRTIPRTRADRAEAYIQGDRITYPSG